MHNAKKLAFLTSFLSILIHPLALYCFSSLAPQNNILYIYFYSHKHTHFLSFLFTGRSRISALLYMALCEQNA